MTDDEVMVEAGGGTEPESGPRVLFNYWAGARAAAGTDRDVVSAGSVDAALSMVRAQHADPDFDRVLGLSSLMIDGRVVRGAELLRPLPADAETGAGAEVVVEVLPPFAGGARPSR